MYELRQMLLDRAARGRPEKKISPKGLVFHWTANTNKGADADNNRNYFNNSGVAASAHYVVDDHQVVQCLPENEMAYHVGARRYTTQAIEKLSGYPNDCTIGIEICVNCDGDFQKTMENTVALAADICKKHGWTKDNLWRHYDITEKDCPKFFVTDATARAFGFSSAKAGWEEFKNMIGEGPEVDPVTVRYQGTSFKGFIKDGRTFVEVRELCTAFGKKVSWDSKNKVVEVKD